MMHKGIKILANLVSTVLLFVLFLPVAASLLLTIDRVQTFVVQRAAKMASEAIGVRVHVGSVSIALLDHVRLHDLCIEDTAGDTMIFARTADVSVGAFGRAAGGLALREARLEGAVFRLREMPDGVMNIKQVVDRLSRRDRKKKGDFQLTIERLEVDTMEFRLQKRDTTRRRGGINWSDMRIREIRAEIGDFRLAGPVVSGRIRRFAGREQTGFAIRDLTGGFLVDDGIIELDDTRIVTAESDLKMERVRLHGKSWGEYKDFVDNVEIDAAVMPSHLTSADLSSFAPALEHWNIELDRLQGAVTGRVADLKARNLAFHTEQATRFAGDVRIKGLPDVKKSRFEVQVRQLATQAADASQLMRAVTRKPLPAKLYTTLRRAGEIRITGQFDGRLDDFVARAVAASECGTLTGDVKMSAAGGKARGVDGTLLTRNFQLGRLLGTEKLGGISFDLSAAGTMGSKESPLRVTGDVSRLEFNGAVYDAIHIEGRSIGKLLGGDISSRDRKAVFDARIEADLEEELPRYLAAVDLQRIDLHAMNINRRDTVSVLSGRIEARAEGPSIDRMHGEALLSDMRYAYDTAHIEVGAMRILVDNTPSDKRLDLTSDLLEVSYVSQRSYQEDFRDIRARVASYLPTLLGGASAEADDKTENKTGNRTGSRTGDGTDDGNGATGTGVTDIRVAAKRIDPILDAVAHGWKVADNSILELTYDPSTEKLAVHAASSYIERQIKDKAPIFANYIVLGVDNTDPAGRTDSLVFSGKADFIRIGNLFRTRDFTLRGGARDDRFSLRTDFRDTTAGMQGQIGIRGRAWGNGSDEADRTDRGYGADKGNESDGGYGAANRRVTFTLDTAYLRNRQGEWRLSTDSVVVDPDSARVDFRHFRITSPGRRGHSQLLEINGRASKEPGDTVTLKLQDFDLSPFTTFVEPIGYRIDGTTNGYASVSSMLGAAAVRARIELDSLRVNDMVSPPLLIRSFGNMERDRVGMLVLNRRNADTLVRAMLVPTEGRYQARMTVDNVGLSLLDPILSGVVENTSGAADMSLLLRGVRSEASLTGRIDVRDMRTRVVFTQVDYRMPSARIEVVNSLLEASGVPFYDEDGDAGSLGLRVDLADLGNIAFRLKVDMPRPMLVLNTTPEDNDIFYGRVYASGSATIRGDNRGVRMEIDATTRDNTRFTLPLSGKADVSKADFVTFVEPDTLADVDYATRRMQELSDRSRRKRSGGGQMQIDMEIEVQREAKFFLGDMLSAEGTGSLDLRIRPAEGIFNMNGTYTLERGEFQLSLQNIINKKFEISEGSTIRWSGDPMDAMLDITAVYSTRASLQPLLGSTSTNTNTRQVPVECVITLTDRLSSPTEQFSIRIPNADSEAKTAIANILNTESTITRQFLYLLLTSSFYPENASSSTGSIGSSASAATGIGVLTNQLSSWLSNENFGIILRYSPKSETSSDEVDFGVSTGLFNNRLLIELEGNYMLDDHMSVGQNQVSNFMGEASVTWLLDHAGTFRLRGFTHTIDRFDENQGLQQTGIGISAKLDFNKVRDIIPNLKALARERRERREERKRQQERQRERLKERSREQRTADRTAARQMLREAARSLRLTAEKYRTPSQDDPDNTADGWLGFRNDSE